MKKFLLFNLLALICLGNAAGDVILDSTAKVTMEIKNPIEAEKTACKELMCICVSGTGS